MEIIQKKVVERKENTVYIANDGTEFENMQECVDYEREAMDALLEKSGDVIENKDAEDCLPFDGNEWYENHDYRWFKPLNKKGIDLLYVAFGIKIHKDYINEWVCLEISDDDTYMTDLKSSLEYAENMKKKFGIGDEVTSDSEYEYILNFANSGTFDYEDNSDLKTLRVLWTAYCLHRDYDADTANYDSGISEIFSKLGEKTSDFEEKGFDKFDRYMCKYLV